MVNAWAMKAQECRISAKIYDYQKYVINLRQKLLILRPKNRFHVNYFLDWLEAILLNEIGKNPFLPFSPIYPL